MRIFFFGQHWIAISPSKFLQSHRWISISALSLSRREMAKNKVRFIKPGIMGQPVSDYEKQRREKIELNNLRLVGRGFQRMVNSLVDLKNKGKTKTTKEVKNMRAMDDDDEEYQLLEDENNLSSDDHLSSYSDEEELIDAIRNERRKKNVVAQHTSTPHIEMPPMQSTVPPSSTQGSMPTPTSMVGIPGSLTTETTMAPTPTQDLLAPTHTVASLPQDMVRGTFFINVSFIYVKTKRGKTENESSVQ